MGEQFRKHDVCVGQNYVRRAARNGMECEIIDSLRVRMTIDPDTGDKGESLTYLVLWADGTRTAAGPDKLRRKPAPRVQRDIDAVVRWSDCDWVPQPVKLAAAIKRAKEST